LLTAVITILHIVVSLGIILVVLLQSGKGGDLAGVFGGGGGEGFFGGRGPASFLARLTTGAAVLFILTSLLLGIFPNLKRPSPILQREAVEAPVAAPQSGDNPPPAEGTGNVGSTTQEGN